MNKKEKIERSIKFFQNNDIKWFIEASKRIKEKEKEEQNKKENR